MSAAYGSLSGNFREEVAGSVNESEQVFVLYDTYGKDYWACYVRTVDGQFGWILCTDVVRN
ncbi:hypothetical protein ACFSJ3_03890 [Corallincola platygyrae]|uniref:SH3 domain-containing protein n=1 Tax=Corallincola platygyrae TaxID=1193278 RepID=A0ABW4XLF9_9GAMM